jgi:hypothetical protein
MGIICKDLGMSRIATTIPRKHTRQMMRRAAWLSLDSDSEPIGCIVWDLSKGGCRFTAPHSVDLPDVFALIMRSNSKAYHFCRVIWRKGAYVGVRFIDPAEAQQLTGALPDSGTAGLYLKNDRDAWSAEQRKQADAKARARQAQNSRKRPKFNIQLY